jgi:hypothetical protein
MKQRAGLLADGMGSRPMQFKSAIHLPSPAIAFSFIIQEIPLPARHFRSVYFFSGRKHPRAPVAPETAKKNSRDFASPGVS